MQVDDKLYAVAMQCAKLNNQGCSCNCHLCQYNIYNYVSDVREASLLKATAYTDFEHNLEIDRRVGDDRFAESFAPLVFLLLLVAGFTYCCSSLKSCVSSVAVAPVYSYENPTQTIQDAENELLVNQLKAAIESIFGD